MSKLRPNDRSPGVTPKDWRDRAVFLRDAANERRREARKMLEQARVFGDTSDACIVEADRLEAEQQVGSVNARAA